MCGMHFVSCFGHFVFGKDIFRERQERYTHRESAALKGVKADAGVQVPADEESFSVCVKELSVYVCMKVKNDILEIKN